VGFPHIKNWINSGYASSHFALLLCLDSKIPGLQMRGSDTGELVFENCEVPEGLSILRGYPESELRDRTCP
jgi:hypothetical protein